MKKPRWTRTIKVGDVLSNGHGNRVVREVTRRDGLPFCVQFTIKHCSWTGRCYTTMNIVDLLYQGYAPVGVRVPLKSRLDKKIQKQLRYENRFKKILDCCDVKGVA